MSDQFLSVWDGDDASLIDKILDFYPSSPVKSILDCTFNSGKFWKKSKNKSLVTGMDVDPTHNPDLVDDNRVMDKVASKSFDVVVYDPPHVPNQGKDRTKDFCNRFGLGEKSKNNLSHDYILVMNQVKRVLKDGGLCLCKITDYVHNHRYQWALVDLIEAIRGAGMTPCDLIIKVRKNPIVDPKWKTSHHARKCHCYWVVVRNSKS